MRTFDMARQLGEIQHGVAARRQLRELGIDRWMVERWQRRGLIEPVTDRVVRFGGAPATALQRVAGDLLDAGDVAVGSLWTGAWLWRLPGFDLDRSDATVLRGDDTRAPRRARLHRPRLLLPHHVTQIEGIPVTSLARTIFD